MSLTTGQIRFFRENGYLRLSARLPDSVVARVRREIAEQVDRRAEPLRTNPEGRVTRLSHLYERGPVFQEAILSATLLDPMERLLGPNVDFLLNRHNHATLNFRDAIPRRLHRDNMHWSRPLVTAIIYLEPATSVNGCTEVIPGSHYLPFVPVPNNGGTWMDEHAIFEDLVEQSLPVPMPEGGVLLLDGAVFHTIGINQSEGTRMSLTLAFTAVDELLGVNELPHRVVVRGARVYKGG